MQAQNAQVHASTMNEEDLKLIQATCKDGHTVQLLHASARDGLTVNTLSCTQIHRWWLRKWRCRKSCSTRRARTLSWRPAKPLQPGRCRALPRASQQQSSCGRVGWRFCRCVGCERWTLHDVHMGGCTQERQCVGSPASSSTVLAGLYYEQEQKSTMLSVCSHVWPYSLHVPSAQVWLVPSAGATK